MPAKVERLEYDPNRTAFIALVKYEDGELAYILAPQRLSPGDRSRRREHVDVKPGNAMPIGNIPIGTIVHNIEIKIGKGGQIARSAGTYAQIVGRDDELRDPAAQFDRAAPGAWPLHLRPSAMASNPDEMNTTVSEAGHPALEGPPTAQSGASR